MSLSFVHNASRQHIICLYGTPAVRQAVLRLAWYIRLIRFEIRFERKKNDSQVPIVKILNLTKYN